MSWNLGSSEEDFEGFIFYVERERDVAVRVVIRVGNRI